MTYLTALILSTMLIPISFIVSLYFGNKAYKKVKYDKWNRGFLIRTAIDEQGIYVKLDGDVLLCTMSVKINRAKYIDLLVTCSEIITVDYSDPLHLKLTLNENFNPHNLYRCLLNIANQINLKEEPKIWTQSLTHSI